MVAKLKLLNGSLLISGNKQQTIQLFKSNRITPKTVKAWFSKSPCCSNPDLEIQIQENLTAELICKNCNYRELVTILKINHKEEQTTEKRENIFIKLYGIDAIPMGTLRSKVFNSFISSIGKKYIVKPNPDGYITSCLICGGNLLVNKFTGITYCFNCKQELPFEYLFEILKGCDIYSIVQEIQNQQTKTKFIRW